MNTIKFRLNQIKNHAKAHPSDVLHGVALGLAITAAYAVYLNSKENKEITEEALIIKVEKYAADNMKETGNGALIETGWGDFILSPVPNT